MNLFINACVREGSRTKRLADHLLKKLEGPVSEVRVGELCFPPADRAFLALRDELIRKGDFAHPLFDLARQFAAADTVVVAAPYWDLSFPAALKQYFEQINVTGVTFAYSPEGIPIGHCRAKKLYYVTTAGGPILSPEFGYGYVEGLARGFYQIPEVRMIRAEGLDILGADVEGILHRAEKEIDALFAAFEIVRIGLEDWPKCGAIWNMETFPYTEQFREQIRAGNREVFVLTVDGTYIAECDLVKDNPEYGTVPGRRLYLSRLIVRRDCRGQGYGRALTAHLLDLARKRGYREIALGVDRDNAPALGLYRSLGFAIYDEAEDQDGEFYRMEKTLRE